MWRRCFDCSGVCGSNRWRCWAADVWSKCMLPAGGLALQWLLTASFWPLRFEPRTSQQKLSYTQHCCGATLQCTKPKCPLCLKGYWNQSNSSTYELWHCKTGGSPCSNDSWPGALLVCSLSDARGMGKSGERTMMNLSAAAPQEPLKNKGWKQFQWIRHPWIDRHKWRGLLEWSDIGRTRKGWCQQVQAEPPAGC